MAEKRRYDRHYTYEILLNTLNCLKIIGIQIIVNIIIVYLIYVQQTLNILCNIQE